VYIELGFWVPMAFACVEIDGDDGDGEVVRHEVHCWFNKVFPTNR
jgi:hypothetical protein